MTRLICITGMDGCGKSTLIARLKDSLPLARVSHIWEIMEGGIAHIPFGSKKDVDQYLCALTPDARLLFLAHALRYSLDRALNTGQELVLLNAYYYKYFASELALGVRKDLVDSLIRDFPQPDLVICLQLSPEVASHRKTRWSGYECGCSNSPNRETFLDFQKRCREYWKFFDQEGWVYLNGENSPDDLLKQALKLISQP